MPFSCVPVPGPASPGCLLFGMSKPSLTLTLTVPSLLSLDPVPLVSPQDVIFQRRVLTGLSEAHRLLLPQRCLEPCFQQRGGHEGVQLHLWLLALPGFQTQGSVLCLGVSRGRPMLVSAGLIGCRFAPFTFCHSHPNCMVWPHQNIF